MNTEYTDYLDLGKITSDSGFGEPKLVVVETIVTHVGAHLDELFAIWLLKKYGSSKFTGIESAPIKFVSGGGEINGDEQELLGNLYIGLGRGRYDEHRGPEGRLKNTSACKLVAEDLGIEHRPEIVCLLERVNFGDNNVGVKTTELGELVKILHRKFPVQGDRRIMEWVFIAFDVIANSFGRALPENTKRLGDIHRCLQKKNRYANAAASQRLQQLIESSERAIAIPTELSAVLADMCTCGHTAADIKEWMLLAFDSIYNEQIVFLDVANHAKANMRRYEVRAMVRNKLRPLDLIVYRSDHELSVKVVRHLQVRAGVILICRSTGHYQIFVDARSGLSARALVAMLRWLELPDELRVRVPWHILETPGELRWDGKILPTWYYHFGDRAENVFNGSRAHMSVPRTHIPFDRIIFAIEHAFTPHLVREWRAYYGI